MQQTKVFCFFLFASLLFFVTPVGQAQSKNKPKVDVFGYYFLIAPFPPALADIDHVHLSTIDQQGKDAPLNGFIRLKARKVSQAVDFPYAQIKLQDKTLTFETKTIKTVRYEFTGTFTKLGDFPNAPPTKGTILEGELTQWKGKDKLVSSKVRFRYVAGD